ncbi:hypothetical protein [Brevibacillus brevis]|uniref:hypothetical protein n=1 Tax=Brevibacillus brevis TaxID=1393 RepID=UPI000D0FB3A2|nr:hypothetical protein [Brevibacillus brevis]PSJ66029.1 hypothetical protein C7J99_28675 [Brevibacillus brevis]RED27946.1 hypothetical protein DES34_109241 [Brevibacillus brevis]GEC88784.1 hypothetical protein BBR01nite_11150 [Brevibacillus brevis]VEF86984.1 Uncharacterised protein [Brevibacillus brevis]
MAYQKTTWVDHIVDPVTGEVVQQGTKVTATRMNKMEQGIADAQVLTEALAQTVIGSPVVSGLEFSASGLTAQWTAGVAYVNGVRFEVNAGSIKLSATQGQYIYLDSDGVVKNTTSQATADAKCKLWYFATDASSIITSVDGRNMVSKEVFVKQTEVADNGANKIPRLDGTGKGAFSITGEAGGTQAKLDAHTVATDPHTQYARKHGNSTLTIANNTPTLQLQDLNGEADKKIVNIVNDSGATAFHLVGDDGNWVRDLIKLPHDGTDPSVSGKTLLHAENMNALLGNKNALFNSSAALDLIGWKDVTNHGNFFAGEGGYGEVNFFGHYSNTSTLYESLDSTPIRLAPTAQTTLSGEVYTVGLIGANALVELHYMDSNLNTLKQEQVLIPSGKHWEFFSITSIAPVNTVYCKVRLALPPNSTNTNTAWRKLKLENGSRATPYDNSADITHINKRIGDYNVFKSGKDSNGVYTVVDYKQRNGALVMKSTLSNPDSSGNYQTLTKKYYSLSGFNYYTEVWTFTYDADGQILSQVVKND